LRVRAGPAGALLLLLPVLAACSGNSATMGAPTPGGPAAGGSGVNPTPAQPTDILTYKYDLARSGQNLTESILTLANVNPTTFGLQRFLTADGKVDAQPLYLSGLTLQNASHNVVFVATENDSVYAFDADNGATLWHASLLPAGETVNDLPAYGCGQVAPTIGITSTPVIDRSAGAHGTLFVVAMSRAAAGATYHQRLHALDVTTGAELLNGPAEISATYPKTGGTTTFDPGQHLERAALLLAGGTLYTSWTSHCDTAPYYGWIMAFSESTLAQSAVLNVAANSGGHGPAIWMSGAGPAADSSGNVYLLTANGVFETTLNASGFPSGGDYGNSFLKLALAGGTLSVIDFFSMWNSVNESGIDQDLASGGIMLLPDLTDSAGTVRHLAIGAGKDQNLYVVDRDSMGRFDPNANRIWQELADALPGGIYSSPAYFNGTVYYGPVNSSLMAFAITAAQLASVPSSATPTNFTYPGTSPVVSANGTSNAIVWAHENGNPAVLHAYDAGNLAHELYNSSQAAAGRDQFGPGNKFITPVVADGKVFVGTTSGVAVFGPLD
jgi:outer membrane protein assembly factor BamB